MPVTLPSNGPRGWDRAIPKSEQPTVYAVHDDGSFDLSDAARYGNLRTIFRKDFYPDTMDEVWPLVERHAYDVMSNFTPDLDYVCLIGSPMYTALVFHVLGHLKITPVRALRFDKKERAYYVVTIGL